jgi:hypothetical protein
MYSAYLLYHSYREDRSTGFGEFGHLLAYNPAEADTDMRLTFYHEDQDPSEFLMRAKGGTTTESNYLQYPLKQPVRFAIQVDSAIPLVCQSTVGWNNVANDYRGVHEVDPRHRETVISYTAITALAREWYHPDCIVINSPSTIWVREPENLIVLNPSAVPAAIKVDMAFDDGSRRKAEFVIQPQRLLYVSMDDIAIPNVHYGVKLTSDQPVAAQWQRIVKWYNSEEIMAYWSVPLVAGPLH